MEFWTKVRRRVLTGQLSKRAACREYELNWHTVQKILAHPEPPGYRRKQPRRKPKLAAFVPIIQEILVQDKQALHGWLHDREGRSAGLEATAVTPFDRFHPVLRPAELLRWMEAFAFSRQDDFSGSLRRNRVPLARAEECCSIHELCFDSDSLCWLSSGHGYSGLSVAGLPTGSRHLQSDLHIVRVSVP